MSIKDHNKEALLQRLELADAKERLGSCSIEDRIAYLEDQVSALRNALIGLVCGEQC